MWGVALQCSEEINKYEAKKKAFINKSKIFPETVK